MQTEPNQFADVLTLLKHSLVQTAPLDVKDAKLNSFLDSYSIFQQIDFAQFLKDRIAQDPTDKTATDLLRCQILFERTRARIARDAHAANRALEPNCPERDEAINFLLTELAEGDRPARELFAIAQSIGISQRTLKRAKSALNIASRLDRSPGQKRAWIWSLTGSTLYTPPISSQ